MDENKFMLVSLDDEKSRAIAEVLASPTCKKIINYLAEHKEASQKDLSDKLHVPMNTLDYNMKKLLSSGFIQKRKNFFWSRKGKKIILYELSNKSVVISPRKSASEKIKSVLPAFILAAAGTFAIWMYEKISFLPRTAEKLAYGAFDSMESAGSIVPQAVNHANIITSQPTWLWFLFGSLLAIFIIAVLNWRKL
jgi:DNA-binding Lrp family transcriptional regulator